MLMDNIRRGAKKHRTLMMIIVGALCLSLLAGVVFMGGGGRQQSEVTLAQQIEAYEKLIADSRTRLAEKPNDYSANESLGDLLLNLSSMYTQNNEAEKAKTAAEESAACYETSLKNPPEGLSKIGEARIISKLALAYEFAGDLETAETNFAKSIEIGEHDWQVEGGYIDYMFRQNSYAAALEYAQTLVGVYPEGSDELANLNYTIAILGLLSSSAEGEGESTDK